MHEPLPVSVLLEELAVFATAVQQSLTATAIDWKQRPASGEWSLTEVICHLRDVEREVHQVRFCALIAAENIFLPGATPDEWAAERHYQEQDGRAALADFIAARRETIALLAQIDNEALWDRQGRHAFFGHTTMHELLHLVVKHDQAHWQQIKKLLGEIES